METLRRTACARDRLVAYHRREWNGAGIGGYPCAPDLDMTYIEHGRRLGRPPVNEALIAIAAGIWS
jgi:hypothetical protein